MSLFSPIANRSLPTRLLYLLVYLVLAVGAITMVVPLGITVSGAMGGAYDANTFALYPRFLFSNKALWNRYIESKYGGILNNFKMGWGREQLDFFNEEPIPKADPQALALWERFRKEVQPKLTTDDAGLAHARSNNQNAALETSLFRRWVMNRYDGEISRVNEALSASYPNATAIVPPGQNRVVLLDVGTPFQSLFREYLNTVEDERRLIWNVGNFYRAVFLPRIFGSSIADYNKAQGTHYADFESIPFPETAPTVGRDPWVRFVKELLNPAFVTLSPEGEQARKESGLSKLDFIRMNASGDELKVESLDTHYTRWAAAAGVTDARIPQAQIDYHEFQGNESFWRKQFAWQNFALVLDEVIIQGNGARNTFILVVLSVVGALTVNPMAAYALSRFKLKQSYQVLLFFLATIAFPAEVAMIPNFLQIKELGMINTFWALVIPGLVSGFSIFLLKGFFDSLPRELYEAADIDGASEWQIFWGITMNLSKPILAVIALGAFTSAYGAFMFALILAPDPEMWTLMVWIYQLQQGAGQGVIYASILITALPLLIVYIFTQNIIMRGIIVPSEK